MAFQTAVVVSGAGSDRGATPVEPAAYDGVLAVASTDRKDRRLEESNYGTWVDVSAPGRDAFTTTAGGGYRARSGTSIASAYVADLAGLVRSWYPDCPPHVVREQIIGTADNIDGQNRGYEGLLGSGRIHAARAVGEAVQVDPGDEHDRPAAQFCGERRQPSRLEPG